MKKGAWALLWKLGALGAMGATLAAVLVYHGIWWPNTPSTRRYPVRGIDVSSWQGEIDWQVLAVPELSFAFVKATEGSTHRDSRFAANWAGAGDTHLRVGAYHFFSFDSPGASQADNFVEVVPVTTGMLPPVVDVEFYGDKKEAPPRREEVEGELQVLLDRLEAHYGQPPILYATMDSYRMYLEGGYGEHPVWIRSIWTRPALPDGRLWTFWQYSNRGRLAGTVGEEPYVDLNVFYGSLEEFYPGEQ